MEIRGTSTTQSKLGTVNSDAPVKLDKLEVDGKIVEKMATDADPGLLALSNKPTNDGAVRLASFGTNGAEDINTTMLNGAKREVVTLVKNTTLQMADITSPEYVEVKTILLDAVKEGFLKDEHLLKGKDALVKQVVAEEHIDTASIENFD